ncbi:MAG: 6-phosphofructokinase [Verrucomicrobiia bacterium]
MGRHAGFLTAASMLGRRSEADGPHLVYVPEVVFHADKFLADVDAACKKWGRCLIAVSEGVHDEHRRPMAAKLAEMSGAPIERDSHGNVQLSGSGVLGDFLADLIKKQLKIKRVRADTFGYLQRSFAGCVSESDAREARESAHEAGRLAVSGEHDGSVAIQRVSDDPYKVTYKRIELTDVAAKTRHLDPSFIVNGNNIADSFKTYALPLVGKLPEVDTVIER